MLIPLVAKFNKYARAIVAGEDENAFEVAKELSKSGFYVDLITADPLPEEVIRKNKLREFTNDIWTFSDEKVKHFHTDLSNTVCIAMSKDKAVNEDVYNHFMGSNYRLKLYSSERINGFFPHQLNFEGIMLGFFSLDGKAGNNRDSLTEYVRPITNALGLLLKENAVTLENLEKDSEKNERLIEGLPEILKAKPEEFTNLMDIYAETVKEENYSEITIGYLKFTGNYTESSRAELFSKKLKEMFPNIKFRVKAIQATDSLYYNIQEERSEEIYPQLSEALQEFEVDVAITTNSLDSCIKSNSIREWRNVLPRANPSFYFITKSEATTLEDVLKSPDPVYNPNIVDNFHFNNYLDYKCKTLSISSPFKKAKFTTSHLIHWMYSDKVEDNFNGFLLTSFEEMEELYIDEDDIERKGFRIIPIDFCGMTGTGRSVALTRKNDAFTNKLMEEILPNREDKISDLTEARALDLLMNENLLNLESTFAQANCLFEDGLFKIILSPCNSEYPQKPTHSDLYSETDWLKEDDLNEALSELIANLKDSLLEKESE